MRTILIIIVIVPYKSSVDFTESDSDIEMIAADPYCQLIPLNALIFKLAAQVYIFLEIVLWNERKYFNLNAVLLGNGSLKLQMLS